jgi:SET domain-containing protein
VGSEVDFFAARDIAEGEELTVRYTDFSEAR